MHVYIQAVQFLFITLDISFQLFFKKMFETIVLWFQGDHEIVSLMLTLYSCLDHAKVIFNS